MTSTGHVKQQARRAEASDVATWGARAGLLARGLLWLVVGLLAVNIALGGGGNADKNGALAALRDQPFGRLLLVVLAAAFAAHALFRLLEGTVGRREEEDDGKMWLKRAWSLCRVGVYGFLAYSCVHFLVAGGTSKKASGPTARIMELPAGRTLVGLVGTAIVVAGIVQAVRGLRQDFTDKLALPTGTMRAVVKRVGAAGLVGRGLVYALVGSFLVQAAVTFDPEKAKGLDEALKTLAGQAFGTPLLLLAAAGLVSFAAWSFLEARYHDY